MQPMHERWYLLRFLPNHWRLLLMALGQTKAETCCPMLHTGRLRKDKINCIRHHVTPAFAGYVFVRFNPEDIPIAVFRRMPGAIDFVRVGKEIMSVPEQTIQLLRCGEARVVGCDRCSYACLELRDADVQAVTAIYTSASPQDRIALLMALVTHANREESHAA